MLLAIDPGKCKCGLILADKKKKKVHEALVVESKLLVSYVRDWKTKYSELVVLIGNGTTSNLFIEQFDFIKKDLFVVNERNTTLRAKKRYFEIFPLKGISRLLPRELMIQNINLDAISALIILEDYCQSRYVISDHIDPKIWQK